MIKIINNKLKYDLEEKIYNKNRRKNFFLRNKIKFGLETKILRRKASFYIWNNLPYSFIIFTPSLKKFHHMQNNFYQLRNGIMSRKQRFFYKKDYSIKDITSFYCYRFYMKDISYFFSLFELILDYDITIVGLELNEKVYSIEDLFTLFKNLKNDLKFFFKVNDFDFNFIYSQYFNNLNLQCQLLTN